MTHTDTAMGADVNLKTQTNVPVITANPTLLALDTSTPACSVALLHNGQIEHMHEVGNNIHSQVLLPMVNTLMSNMGITASQLDAVAVGQGPGSFTGLRIGVGAAQGIAYGAGCPMVGVSSLAVLAQALVSTTLDVDGVCGMNSNRIIAGIDARMGEAYWAEFDVLLSEQDSSNKELREQHVLSPLLPPQYVSLVGALRVTPPEFVRSDTASHQLVGNAWVEYWDKLDDSLRANGRPNDAILYPHAADLLSLALIKYHKGDWVQATEFAPVYVRNDVAKKSNKPLPGKRV